ncbi:hypothetical protein F4782DRAFT_528582 [Xylaria castorea]|nr:hypothetical protein F4782DRAFT_528582 [Xylaria castorea]
MAQASQYLRKKNILRNDIKPPNYLPPEYLKVQERKVPSDIWALGINFGLVQSTANAHMRKRIKIVEGEVKKMAIEDGKLDRVVSRMLPMLPRQRITAGELVSAVEALVLRGTKSKASG